MKKLFLLALCFTGSYVFAQSIQQSAPLKKPAFRLNAYASYAFDDKVDSYYSATEYFEGTIKGGFEYGGGLEFMLRETYGVEFTYLRLDSKAPLTYYDNVVKNTTFDLASNFLMLGGNRYLKMNPKLEPYAGIQLGMVIYNVENPDNGKSGSATKFAWGLKAGVNIWATEKVGIKIQAGLISAVQSVGGGLYFGTGGAGAGVASYSTIYQFTVGGGLTFNLGK
jgi:hypothetical protein